MKQAPKKRLRRALRQGAFAVGPIVALAILATLSRDWLFNYQGSIDPWMYRAIINDWGDPDTWVGNYKTSRLGWVVPAWVLSPMTNGYWGQVGLGLLLLAVGGALVGLAVGRLLGRGAGIVSGVVTAAWASLIFSGGPSYHNSIVPVWFGCALALTAFAGRATTRRSRGALLVAAGASGALLLHANPISINLLPILLIAGIASAPTHLRLHFRTYRLVPLWIASGAMLSTALLSIIALSVGRSPWFFMDGISLILRTSGAQESWYVPITGSWLSSTDAGLAWHLVLPAAGFLCALGVLARTTLRKSWGAHQARNLLAFGVVATCLLYLAWHLLGQTSLVPGYFAYSLGLASAIGIALPAADFKASKGALFYAVAATWGFLFAIWIAALPVLPRSLTRNFELSWFVALALALFGGLLLAVAGRSGIGLFLLAAIALGLANSVALARFNGMKLKFEWTDHTTGCDAVWGRADQAMAAFNEKIDNALPGARAVKGRAPVLWWPRSLGDQELRCYGGGALERHLRSLSNMGYQNTTGDRASLAAIAESRTPFIAISDRKRRQLKIGGSDLTIECQHGFRIQIPTSRAYACIGFLTPR